jgi:hypothetical protein
VTAFIVKRRSLVAARPNMYGHKVKRGPWRTVSSHDSEEAAQREARKQQGLYEVAVFYGGKRLEA